MKTKFPKLQNFLIKPSKDEAKGKKSEKDQERLNVSSAFVYKKHLIATDGKVVFVFQLKEYLRFYAVEEKDEDSTVVVDIINKVVDSLEGKALPREFFAVFSKMQTIMSADFEKVYMEQNGFHAEFRIENEYPIERLESFLNNQKNSWNKERSEQSQLCVAGNILSSITSVLSSELSSDSLVFERRSDGMTRFSFANKDFVFGLCLFDTDAEQSITKFIEGDEFFEQPFV